MSLITQEKSAVAEIRRELFNLEERQADLADYLASDDFPRLNKDQRLAVVTQFGIQRAYIDILRKRVRLHSA